jgi:hypothetical protein
VGREDFLDPLVVEHLDGRRWRLKEPFSYVSTEALGRRLIVSVPHGFVTDFASVPRFFWRVLPPTGEYGKAAVVHDWLYRTHLTSREEADRVFLEAMRDLGVAEWKARTMYRAVRLFGGKAWADGPGQSARLART